eukprot:GHVS01077284.1.p1 GENE.GHVS01077284.1~~GHVS01077284.1.p1  ORF type:complete len:560 (-),score=62.69 GHVS01077284.1:118-1599(-)
MSSTYNWGYNTVPQKHLGNRVLYHPRGKVLGGSSSLNAMVFIRGHALDFDRWGSEQQQEGCSNNSGWSYADCLPYFRRAETYSGGSTLYRGREGPLQVTEGACTNALHKAFLQAGVQAGYPYTEDVNGQQQEGFGKSQLTVGAGKRCSTAAAYLHGHQLPNLTVLTGGFVERVLFQNGRASGVRVEGMTDDIHVRSDGQVILSGGAFNSPHLLMLSGVGPRDQLTKHGIDIVQELPGVGQNLQDHLEFYAQWRCTQPITLLNSLRPHNMLRIGIQWFLTRTGEGASSHLETGAFTRSRPDVPHPDIQWHFLPGLIENHGRSAASFHAFQLHIGTLRSKSRGSVTLQSSHHRDKVVVDPQYFSDEQDIADMRVCVQQAREVVGQVAFDEFRGEEIRPGPQVTSNEDIDVFLRNSCESAYHPSCTCRMGPETNPMSVVDPNTMNVWGFENLKVVDASVMPSIVSGNLNAATIMLAEKASDIILKHPPLLPSVCIR